LACFETTRRVPFTPSEMFAVVADIESYPLFLPLCESLTITSRTETGADTVLVATMAVGYRSIRELLTTRVTLSPAQLTILVDYIEGPFRHLENRWRFVPVPGGADVGFSIEYEFRSVMLRLLMGAVFDKAVRHYAEAFEARARLLYGAPSRVPGA